EFKQDCEEFGKDVAKLIRAFESKPERQEYRSRRRDHVANVNAKRIEFNINKLFVNYKNLMENKHTKISNKSINMDSERT
ncbi:MAG: hypothetical protein GWN01_00325, partial [Nitrosopumilaceae archaeon]|nr:hypothetical protein [Nitrosopumilaceae archaeon]NIU88441.1 hypothetical protein [Nitrosopumilaceae archaeon]NIV66345.1 hypothetical protein [Nitrosopumilaceae archaeon]NIX60032.1 hypothetical protein [Nitrosopumilaceae archaeon]